MIDVGEAGTVGGAVLGSMSPDERVLWGRIAAFELDDPDASMAFSARLARDNGWSQAFATRVVDEYKRFVFLAMAAGHPVTPSDEVDQAWHLHMVYTRSYWEEFCGGVLGKPLHHGPTKGGKREGVKFEDWYARTLASYERMFGEAAPREIWPESRVRFGTAPWMKRVDTSAYFMISKAGVKRAAARVMMGGVAGAGLWGAGCAVLATGQGAISIPIVLLVLGILVAVIVIAIAAANANAGDKSGSGRGSGCGSGCGGSGCGGSHGHSGSDGHSGGDGHSGCGGHSGGGGDSGGGSGCGGSGCGGSGCGGGGD